MFGKFFELYNKSLPAEQEKDITKVNSKCKKLYRSVFLSATIGYSLFYVCRLSLSVVKKPILTEGWLNEIQMGIIGFMTVSVILTSLVWKAKEE